MTNRNFARGEAPPFHSYEWAGVAKPPDPRPGEIAPKRQAPTMIVTEVTSLTMVKKRNWKHILGAGIIGGGIGYIFGRRGR